MNSIPLKKKSNFKKNSFLKNFSYAVEKISKFSLESKGVRIKTDRFGGNHPYIVFIFELLGYYRCLHIQLERRDDLDKILDLIKRPFKFMNDKRFSNVVLSEFCLHFLKSDLTYKMKNVLIPNLKSDNRFNIYKKLVEYLNTTSYFQFSTNLFYYILAFEPEEFGMYLGIWFFFVLKMSRLIFRTYP